MVGLNTDPVAWEVVKVSIIIIFPIDLRFFSFPANKYINSCHHGRCFWRGDEGYASFQGQSRCHFDQVKFFEQTNKISIFSLFFSLLFFVSGCMDEQTSADAHISGESTGAMSFALKKVVEENGSFFQFSLLFFFFIFFPFFSFFSLFLPRD